VLGNEAKKRKYLVKKYTDLVKNRIPLMSSAEEEEDF
jgi:hypothetical protein